MSEGFPVTVADLLRSGEPLSPHEAVAITVELCKLVMARTAVDAVAPAISPSTVRIDASGAVSVAGGVPAEDDQTVSLVGRLLQQMIDHASGERELVVSPRLRATALRAATDGRGAFASLDHLVAALRRHAPEQGHAAIRAVFNRRSVILPPSGPRIGARPQCPPSAPAGTVPGGRVAGADAEAPDEAGGRPVRSWFATVLIVGVTLLLLAGAGMWSLFTSDGGPAPVIAPVPRPIPVSPRREPGWELLGKPERASAVPRSGPSVGRRSAKAVSLRTGEPPTADAPDLTRGGSVLRPEVR
jgi:hypothetical protein